MNNVFADKELDQSKAEFDDAVSKLKNADYSGLSAEELEETKQDFKDIEEEIRDELETLD